jgi:nitrate reductase (cytochrome), electron transfer subunit
MNGGPGRDLPARVAAIGFAVAGMVAAILLVGPTLMPPRADPGAPIGVALTPAGAPIRAEADVFRTRPGDLAADPGVARRPEAHPRTMAMYRSLRAFPGAPPRIPHGLSGQEFRDGRCNTCHERGGYVERFAAYAPVTPHPELGQCLQCHVADDALIGLPFPDGSQGSVCFQCHQLDTPAPSFTELDWATPSWPETGRAALPGAPPAIPHPLQLRENCVACHVGAGAVEELRTTHPERTNCRQCHVGAETPPDVFTRHPTGTAMRAGGGS